MVMLACKGFEPGLVATHGSGEYKYHPGLNTTEKAFCAQTGFHCAENPLECFSWYPWDGKNEFWLVEPKGDIDDDGKKISCTELFLVARLNEMRFLRFVQAYLLGHPECEESWTHKSSGPIHVYKGKNISAAGKLGDYILFINTFMKKSEELEKLCPPPKPSEIAGLSLTATTAMVSGRYINGQVMTVAMWDGKKNPLIVWRFFGDYWTGVRRNKETYLPALRIENVCNELNRHSIPVTKEDDTKIRAYFCNVNYARIEDVIRYGQWQSNEKKKARREELREHGLKYWMSREPEEPKDFEQRIRRANSDIMLLWVGVETEIEVDTAGAHKIKVQKCHCDVCGADFKDYGPKWYAHKESVKCPKCGEELTVQLVRYGAKKKNTSRVFLFGQQSADGYWLKAYNVWFDYTSKRCTLDVTKREVYLLGPNIHYGYNYDWHGDYYYPVMRTTFAPESLFVGSMYTALIGADEKLVDELDDFMDMDYGGPFSKKNRKKYSLTSKLLLWRRTRQMPMAESLIKTGWGESLLRVLETRRGDIQQQINFRSKTYYGVFGLNRAELNAVGEKDFNKVCNAKKWKGQGVAITPENMKQLAEVLSDYTLINLCEKYGARPTLKYLRQVSRRSGAANGEVKRQIAYDWEDYIRMAKKVGVDLKVESNRYPLQLARRHNEMMAVIREKDAAASAERRREMAVSLDKKFGVAKVMKRIRKLYEYKDERYSIIVPADVFDIVKDSTFLGHCVANTNRYYERISSEESYIVFLRQTDKPNRPWYTLEIEPGGTIRQKRSYSNEQYSDLQEAVPFLKEWQQVVQKRMDEKERKLAVESKEKRNKEFEELTVNGNIIHTGRYAGKLLVDELMKDLMEAAATA